MVSVARAVDDLDIGRERLPGDRERDAGAATRTYWPGRRATSSSVWPAIWNDSSTPVAPVLNSTTIAPLENATPGTVERERAR